MGNRLLDSFSGWKPSGGSAGESSQPIKTATAPRLVSEFDEWKKKRKPEIDRIAATQEAQRLSEEKPPIAKPVDQIQHEKSWEERSLLEKTKSVIAENPNTFKKIGKALEAGVVGVTDEAIRGFEPTKPWEQMNFVEKSEATRKQAMDMIIPDKTVETGAQIVGAVGGVAKVAQMINPNTAIFKALGYKDDTRAADYLMEAQTKFSKRYEEDLKPTTYDPEDTIFNNPSLLKNPEYVGDALASQLPHFILGAATGGIYTVGVEGGSAMQGRHEKNQGDGKQDSYKDVAYSATVGVINGVLEKMGIDAIIGKNKVARDFINKSVQGAVKKYIAKVGVTIATEDIGEYLQEVVPQIATKVFYDEGGSWSEVLAKGNEQGLQAASQATIAGGIAGGISHAVNPNGMIIEGADQGFDPQQKMSEGAPIEPTPTEPPEEAPAAQTAQASAPAIEFVTALGNNDSKKITELESNLTTEDLDQVAQKLDQAYNNASDPETKAMIGNDFEYVIGLMADRQNRVREVAGEIVSKKSTENLENDVEGLNVSEVEEVNSLLEKAKEVLKEDLPKATNSLVQTVEKAKTEIETLQAQKKELLAKKSEIKQEAPEKAKEIQTVIDQVDQQIYDNKDLIKQPAKQAGLFDAPISRKEKVETLVEKEYDRSEVSQMTASELDSIFKEETQKKDPLIQEAKKYKSAEEFVKAQGDTFYHTTPAKFDKFDKKYLGKNTNYPNADKGFFFVDNLDQIEEFKNKLKKGFGGNFVNEGTKKTAEELARYRTIEKIAKKEDFFNFNYEEKDLSAKEAREFAEFADKKMGGLYSQDGEVVDHKKMTDSQLNKFLKEEVFVDDLDPDSSFLPYFTENHLGDFIKYLENKGYKGLISNFGGKKNEYLIFNPNTLPEKSQLTDIWNKSQPLKEKSKEKSTTDKDSLKVDEKEAKTSQKEEEKKTEKTEEKSFPNKEPEKGVKIYGEIVGDVAKLSSIEISKSKQKQGLGKKYVAEFEKWAKENGAKKIQIDAYKKSIGFWEKQGYKLEEEFPVIDGVKQDFKNGEKSLEESKIDENISHVEKFAEVFKNLRNGETSLSEYKQAFSDLVANKEAILAELAKKKKDELLKIIGGFGAYQYKSELKDRVVAAAYSSMEQDFALARTVTYTIGGNGMESPIAKMVEATTEADLQEFADKVAQARAQREERLLEMKKSLENPETLDEFRKFIEIKGIKSLTPDQLAQYDELVALEAKKKYEAEKEKRANIQGIMADTEVEIKQTKHTKTGEDLFVAVLSKRVEKETYQELNSAAKRLGGWYSSFRGAGAIPGFQFKSQEDADQFSAVVKGENVKTDRVEQKSEQKTANTALKLQEMAQKLKEKGQESLNRERKDNTSRRAAMAEGAENQARKDIALAETMENLSEAIESGKAIHLFGLSTKTQIELLETTLRSAQNDRGRNEGLPSEKWSELPIDNETIGYVKSMFPSLSVRNLEEIVKLGKDKPGAMRLAEKVGKWIKKASGEVVYPQNIQAMETIKKLARATGIMDQSFSYLKNQIEDYSRLRAMGIESGSQFRAVLKEFSQFKAKEQEADKAKSLERSLVGKKVGFDFFPTPKTVAADMIERADIQPGMKVLEPSAGNGNIAEQIREAGVEPDVAEISSSLRDVLEAKGFKVVDNNFLDIQDGYDRIIMNPPFSNNQDIEHLRHAYSLLNPGGKIVSIVGEGAFFRGGKTETAFRDWLDDLGAEIEKLPENTFTDSKLMVNTGANARLVVLEKPSALSTMANITDKQIDTIISREDVQREIAKVLENANPYLRNRAVINIVEEISSPGLPGSNSRLYSAGIFRKTTGNIDISQYQGMGGIKNLPSVIAHELLHNSWMYLTDAERAEVAKYYKKKSLQEKRDLMGKNNKGEWIYDLYVRDYGADDEMLLEEMGVTEAGRKYTDSRVLRHFRKIVEAFIRLVNRVSNHKAFQNKVEQLDALMVFREAFRDSDFFVGRDYRFPKGEYGTLKSITEEKKETSTEKVSKVVQQRNDLLKKKREIEKAYLDSEQGKALVEKYELQKQFYSDANINVISGIKNNPYFIKQKTINDAMGSGYLMEKKGRYVVVESDRVDTYIERGYTRGIEIDSLASEAGLDNGQEYLEDQLSRIIPLKPETAVKKLLSYTDKLYGEISADLARTEEVLQKAKDDKNSFYLGMRIGGDIMKKKYKEKLSQWKHRKEKVAAAKDFFGLSDKQFNNIGGNRNIQYMTDDEFQGFLNHIEKQAEKEIRKSQAKELVVAQIEFKQLKKTDNLRRAMKLPTIDKMTYEQLTEFDRALESTHFGDQFFSQRQIETVDSTDLKGIRTLREAREKLAERLGVAKIDTGSVVVSPTMDRLRYDTALAEQNPFYKMLVDETNLSLLEADKRYLDIEKEANELIKKARKSKPRNLTDKLVPEDNAIFQYLESSDKATLAKDMTNEEIEAAEFIRRKFEEARDYLVAHETIKSGRENYITHIRRDFFETWKQDGFSNAFKEMFDQQKEDAATFEILSGETGDILPLEKFFQFSLRRTGELKPSENVARAFLTYFKTFEKKRALDSLIPKLDIFVYSITPTQTTDKGLVMDRSLKKFVNAWINNKKGRRFDFGGFLKQGGKADISLHALKFFTSILDLGLSIPGGIASNFGEQAANYTMLGNKKYAKGVSRGTTEKGKRIVEKYRNFIGKNPWKELGEVSRNTGDKFFEALFVLFRDSQVRANKQYLLGSMTDAEFAAETISPERLADMKRDMGRWRVVEGSKSIVGNTSAGGIATQYKTWAIPILRSVGKDTAYLLKTKNLRSKEGAELLRSIIIVGGLALLISAILNDDDDDSFIGKLIKRSTRDLMSIFGALDPTLFFSEPRSMAFLTNIAAGIKQILLLEKYKTFGDGYDKGDLKGINAIKRALKPAVVKQMENKNSDDAPDGYQKILNEAKKSSGNKYKTYNEILREAQGK